MTIALLFSYLLTVAAGDWLSTLNIRHLRRYGHIVPVGFEVNRLFVKVCFVLVDVAYEFLDSAFGVEDDPLIA